MCVPLLARRARRRRAERLPRRRRRGRSATTRSSSSSASPRWPRSPTTPRASARRCASRCKRDGLTGLLNHRACQERLRDELERRRRRPPAVVVVLDLDHFKLDQRRPRPRRGRPRAGRRRRAAALGRARAGDAVGRLGGEEFVLILPGVDAEARRGLRRARPRGAGRADRPRAPAERLAPASPPRPTTATDAAVLLENADAALYWAKRSGRGQTRRYVRGARRAREAEQRDEIAALLRARHGARSGPSSSRCVELATGRAGGYEALARFDGEPRRGPGRVVRARRTASGSAPSSRRSPCAPRSPSPGRPEGTFLALNVSPRALLSAPVQAALPRGPDRDRDRADRARAVRRRGRARDRAGRAARPRRARRARRRGRRLRGPAADDPDRARHPQARPHARPRRARRRARARRCWRR